MITLREKFDAYCAKTALYLRGREADLLRGKPDSLHELELVTDLDLLKKYSWRTAIIAAGVCFFAAPLLVGVMRSFLPELLLNILWALVKLGMAGTCAIFALAAYFTFGPGSSDSG